MKDRNSYIKSITTLVSGSMIAQIVTVLCSPLLTRLYSPDALGAYSLVTGSLTMFGAIMSLRYEVCIVSEPDERKVFPLIKLSIMLCAGISVLIFIGYLVYFANVKVDPHIISLATAAGLLSLLIGVINIVTAYNNRNKEYELITTTYIARILSQNAFSLLAGFIGFGGVGLSYSHILGYCAGVKGQSKELWKKRKDILRVPITEIKSVVKDNKKQALFSTPAAFANGLSYSLINYFIEALYSTALVGFYSVSFRILGMPLTVISMNVSRVFLEKASEEYQSAGNFKSTYKSTVLLLTVIGIPMAAIMICFAPWACEVFFGTGWSVAGEYIRILTPMFILRFIAAGVSCSAIITKKQQYDLYIQILLTAVSISSFVISKVFSLDILLFLQILNWSFSLIYIVYIYLFWICAKGNAPQDDRG